MSPVNEPGALGKTPDEDSPSPADRRSDDYVVVARRYRPKTFDELIGQQHIAKALKQAIATGRVGHAYLFTGARGVGKTSGARIFAKALNCTTGPTETPCNHCDLCLSVSTGDDVDVLEIDGASNRGIDEIRQLRQNVAIRPSRARFKIYIIDEVHMLTKEAFNALLKTLEEPPDHVKFLFATTEPNKIPITILSRCQRFDFAGIESASIQERLSQIAESEGVAIDEESLQILATRAAGSMRDSQSLLEQLLAVAEKQITAEEVARLLGIASAERVGELAGKLVDRDASGALEELSEAIRGGADVGQVLDQLLGYFRDVMTAAVGGKPGQMLYATPSQTPEIVALAARLGTSTLLAILQVLDEAAARLRVSVHARTLAEMAVVRICHLDDLDSLASLVAELRNGTTDRPSPPQPVKRSDPPVEQASPPTASEEGQAEPSQHAETNTRPPPAGNVTLSDAEAKSLWRSAASQVAGLLGGTAALAQAVHEKSGGQLVVRFDEATHADLCNQPLHKGQLESALCESAGRQLQVQFEAPAPSETPTEGPPKRLSRRQRISEVAQRPFVQKAMDLFDVPPDKLRYSPPQGGG